MVVVLTGVLLAGSTGWEVLSGQPVSVTGREVGLVLLASLLAAGVYHALTLPDEGPPDEGPPDEAASNAVRPPAGAEPTDDSETPPRTS